MDIDIMIQRLKSNHGNTWEDFYYFMMNKGYSHSEAICYTYNKFIINNGK